jgi:hypothetical protein
MKQLEEILIKGSNYQSNKLRKRLLRDGIFVPVCNRCDLLEWNSKPIPLELNHKNGDNSDHRIENLELLCPNCHAQTDNYRGKNWGKAVNKHHYANVVQ